MTKQLKPNRELSQRGGHGIDRQLHHFGNTPSVFWSARHNSYVAIVDERGPAVVSINGIGEIRWLYRPEETYMDDEGAWAYFFEEI